MRKIFFMFAMVIVLLSACGTRQQIKDADQAIKDNLKLPDGVEFVSVSIKDVPDQPVIEITGDKLTLSVETVLEKNGQSVDVDLCYVMREGRTSQQMGMGFQRMIGTNQVFSHHGMFSLGCNADGHVQINQDGLAGMVSFAQDNPNSTIAAVLGNLVDLGDEDAVEKFIAPRDTKERSTRIWVQHLEGISGLVPNIEGERSNEIKVKCPK